MQLHILKDNAELSTTVADWMVEYINATLQKQDRFTLVLSGGGTPKKLNELEIKPKIMCDLDLDLWLGVTEVKVILGSQYT